ncbi:histone H2B.1/H2B.2-like [Spea bombifrons]|uniref:histone H2B.1/H2B.2-like n=1 Tax=Spea bombifrons TaxID=233779 RepID=UPI00234A7E67|nr:histone H2B.1/H2B.2-like [Spea bombifrons]
MAKPVGPVQPKAGLSLTPLLRRNKRGRRRRKRRQLLTSCAVFIHQLVGKMRPSARVASKAIALIDELITDIFSQVQTEAARLVRYRGAPLTEGEIRRAVPFLLPRDVAKFIQPKDVMSGHFKQPR